MAIAIGLLVWLVVGGLIAVLIGPTLRDIANSSGTAVSDETSEIEAPREELLELPAIELISIQSRERVRELSSAKF